MDPMPDRLNKTRHLFVGAFCALWMTAAHPQSAQAGVADDGRTRLNAMFAERLDYLRNRGGPYSTREDALRMIRGILMPMPCPHCAPPKPTTEQEEADITSAIRLEAEDGKPQAQFKLATRYLEGKGTALDLSQGLLWLQTAADNGDQAATFALAQIYDGGIGTPVDHEKAAHLYELATHFPGHSTVARLRLGEMNEFGIGVTKDYAKAMALYQANLAPLDPPMPGVRFSQSSEIAIGRLYAQGKGVPQDYVRAAEQFLSATDQGTGYGGAIPDAECALAIMYSTGLGVTRDVERGEFFLHRPNALGMKACQALKADLSSR